MGRSLRPDGCPQNLIIVVPRGYAKVSSSNVFRESIGGKDPELLGAKLARILKDRGAEELL